MQHSSFPFRLKEKGAKCDIVPYGTVVLYSPPKLAKKIPLGDSRTSLRSNITRHKPNIIEKTDFSRNLSFYWQITLIWIPTAPHSAEKSLKQSIFRLFVHDYYLCPIEWFAPFGRALLFLQARLKSL